MRAASVLTVWAITRLVRHQRKVALVGLHDRRCFQIVLVKAMDDFIKSRDVLVEGSQVYVTSFPAVAIRVQRVCSTVFLVYEKTKVLRPVAEWCCGIDELVWAGDVV